VEWTNGAEEEVGSDLGGGENNKISLNIKRCSFINYIYIYFFFFKKKKSNKPEFRRKQKLTSGSGLAFNFCQKLKCRIRINKFIGLLTMSRVPWTKK
jgi:hypothetical protein